MRTVRRLRLLCALVSGDPLYQMDLSRLRKHDHGVHEPHEPVRCQRREKWMIENGKYVAKCCHSPLCIINRAVRSSSSLVSHTTPRLFLHQRNLSSALRRTAHHDSNTSFEFHCPGEFTPFPTPSSSWSQHLVCHSVLPCSQPQRSVSMMPFAHICNLLAPSLCSYRRRIFSCAFQKRPLHFFIHRTGFSKRIERLCFYIICTPHHPYS